MSVVEQTSVDVPVAPGATLRKAREQAGIALETVAQRTMIPLSRLRALEHDDYDRVGVATFVLGYVRAYAKFLGLDPNPLLLALEPALPKSDLVPLQKDPSVALALQVQKRSRSFFWPGVIAIVLILGVVALVGINTVLIPDDGPTRDSELERNTAPLNTQGRVLSLPLEAADRDSSEAAPALEDVESVGEIGEIPTISADESLADTDFALTPSPLSAQTAAPAQSTLTADGPTPSGAVEANDELTFTFSDDCWVGVTDATGKALIARLATSGDNLQLFGRAPFEIVLGNAPAASVAINGQTVDAAPPAGRKFRRLTVGE